MSFDCRRTDHNYSVLRPMSGYTRNIRRVATNCLCYPIGAETQDISGFQPSFGHGTISVREQSEYRGGRVKSLNRN